jgi:rod shape-determining protein MreC
LTIVLLVLASITIITLDYRGDAHGAIGSLKNAASDAFSPVQRAVHDVTHPIGSWFAGAVNGGELEQENAKLRYQLGLAEQQLLAQQAMRNALKAEDALTQLTWTKDIPTVTAQVTALNPSNFAATVELDVGSDKGVAVGMPVVGGAGLVGQVSATSRSSCTVLLITDVSSAVGVRFGPSSTTLGLATGRGIGKSLAVSYVTPGTVLHKGEVLTTSGLQNGLYPPLIPVARITSFSTPSSSQENVTAAPVADLAQLNYVDVLVWPPAPA